MSAIRFFLALAVLGAAPWARAQVVVTKSVSPGFAVVNVNSITAASATDLTLNPATSAQKVNMTALRLALDNGSNSVNIGTGAGASGDQHNVFIGYLAGSSAVGLLDAAAVGYEAAQHLTTGNDISAFGLGALQNNTTSGYNTALGNFALNGLTDAGGVPQDGQNVGVGNTVASLYNGKQSVMIGSFGVRYQTGGDRNVEIGCAVGGPNLSPFLLDNSVLIGYGSGSLLTSGQNQLTLVGTATDVTGGVASNSSALGYQALITASNQINLGNSSVTALRLAGTSFATVSAGAITSTVFAITGVSQITGRAGDMTITAGTGNSRVLNLQSTSSGGTATTFLTGNADGSVALGNGNSAGSTTTGAIRVNGGAGITGDLYFGGNSVAPTTANKGFFWGADSQLSYVGSGDVRFTSVSGALSVTFELLADATHSAALLVQGGGAATYLANSGGASGIINGSAAGDFCVRTGTKNLLISTDNGTTAMITVATSGNTTFTGAIIPSQTNGITGTTTNNSANAGAFGEYVSSAVASGSPVALTNTTPANVTSISLTAGDWDVAGSVNFAETTSTVTARISGFSSTSATLPTDGSEGYCGVQSTVTSETNSITPARKRFSLSATTTIYLVARADFSAGTCGGFGVLTARRAR